MSIIGGEMEEISGYDYRLSYKGSILIFEVGHYYILILLVDPLERRFYVEVILVSMCGGIIFTVFSCSPFWYRSM